MRPAFVQRDRSVFLPKISNRNDGYSPRIGVQLSSGTTRNFQLLLEYFHGKSPNGQFYVNNVEYVGIGGHLHF